MINLLKIVLAFTIVYSISITYYGLQKIQYKVKSIQEAQVNCENLDSRLNYIEEKQNTLFQILTNIDNLKERK